MSERRHEISKGSVSAHAFNGGAWVHVEGGKLTPRQAEDFAQWLLEQADRLRALQRERARQRRGQ